MINFFFFLGFTLFFVLIAVYAERKIAAFVQNRLGPMEVGPRGILQSLADLIKMLQKEDIRPNLVDLIPFLIAPLVVFVSVFVGFAFLPVNHAWGSAVDVSSGVMLLLSIISLDVLGIFIAGWSSSNKYSLYGTMRSVAQIISYEVPLSLSVLCVTIFSGTLNLQELVIKQGEGFYHWNIVRYPILIIPFVVYMISSLAESNRAPFDLPESESEIIGGYHTEYAGFRWGIFMLSEYAMMLLLSILAVTLFFGGWTSPFPNILGMNIHIYTSGFFWEIFWLLSKSFCLIFFMMWVRWTLPRLRVDQLMSLSWKYLTPIALLTVFLSAVIKLYVVS